MQYQELDTYWKRIFELEWISLCEGSKAIAALIVSDEGEIISEGRVIYDKDDIQEYLDIEEESYYNPEVSVPQLRRIVRNTRREMLVYINVQGCKKRHEGNQIVFRWNRFTCDDLIGVFSKQYKLI